MKLLVKTFHGLEQVLADELAELGATEIKTKRRAVACEGDLETIYRINYNSRCALGVLWQVGKGKIRDEKSLYDLMQTITWHEYFKVDRTIRMDLVCFSDLFNNTLYLSQLCKDAVVDQFRDRFGRRPNVSKTPNVRINVFISGRDCIISLDTSGAALFRRGYRYHTGEAPINEVLAAGLIRLTGWNYDKPLVDPMCGSGTIPLEAAQMANKVPAQYFREEDFSLEHYENFDFKLWKDVKVKADEQIREHNIVSGMDLDNSVLRLARKNAIAADLADMKWKKMDFLKWKPDGEPGILLFNPPYDERLEIDDVQDYYSKIGDQLKQSCQGWEAWIITGHLEGSKAIGLRPAEKMTMFNGPLECRFLKFELYEGSKGN